MSGVHLSAMRLRLLAQRRELLERRRHLDAEWDELGEPESELEEIAQKADQSSLYEELEKRELEEIEEIDLALGKLAVGTFGRCERCDEEIGAERLGALPAARLCVGCARRQEVGGEAGLQAAAEVLASAKLPGDFIDLDDEEISEAVMEHIRNDGQVDLDELQVLCLGGVVFLEGVVPSEREHRILLRLVVDDLGLRAVVDHLQITDIPWEREDRTPGRKEVIDLAGSGKSYADPFEVHEQGGSYTAPMGPPPDEE